MNRVPPDRCMPSNVRTHLGRGGGGIVWMTKRTGRPTLSDLVKTLLEVDRNTQTGVLLPSIYLHSDERLRLFIFGPRALGPTQHGGEACLRLYNYVCIRLAAVQFVRGFLASEGVPHSHSFMLGCTRVSCLVEGIRALFHKQYPADVQQLVDVVDTGTPREGACASDPCEEALRDGWMGAAYEAFGVFMDIAVEACRYHCRPFSPVLGRSNRAPVLLNHSEDPPSVLSDKGAAVLSHLLLHVPHLTVNLLAM